MGKSKWPFRPEHITCDADDYADKPHLRKLTGEGILRHRDMQGMQISICAALHNPTTVVEFSPDGEPVRTDSQLRGYDMCRACWRLRECTDHSVCVAQDNAHARLFCRRPRQGLAAWINHQLSNNPEIQTYRKDREVHYRFVDDPRRPYLEYDCSLLGMRELIFPIFFENVVVAVFFVGELCLEEKLPFIRRRQEALLKNYPGCFDAYCAQHQGTSPDDIAQEIRQLHQERVVDPNEVLDEGRYAALISRVGVELAGFEETLADRMKLRRDDYVRKVLDECIASFQTELPPRVSLQQDALDSLWDNLGHRLRTLVDAFSMKYFIAFGTPRMSSTHPTHLDVVTHGENLPPRIAEQALGQVHFDLGRLPASALKHSCTEDECPQLFDGLGDAAGAFDRKRTRIRLVPVPFLERCSIVVLVGYGDENPYTGPDGHSYGDLDRSLWSFYSIAVSFLSSLIAATTQAQMDAALRVFGHEMGQLSAGLDGLRVRYLSDVQRLRNLDEKKLEDIGRDFDAYIQQLAVVPLNARRIFEIPEAKKQTFYAYQELIFKWRDLYAPEVWKNHLEIVIAHPTPADEDRRQIYADPVLLEQLLYNLLNNAVKYSYRGTRIEVDCRKRDRARASPHILTVTDYGAPMPNDPRLFELFERGWTGVNQGLGIGLFIAKQIALAHGGSINSSSEKVCDFNVPLITSYVQTEFPGKNFQLGTPLLGALHRLRASNQLDAIVTRDPSGAPRYKPTRVELAEAIELPTYRVTFTVEIPAKE